MSSIPGAPPGNTMNLPLEISASVEKTQGGEVPAASSGNKMNCSPQQNVFLYTSISTWFFQV